MVVKKIAGNNLNAEVKSYKSQWARNAYIIARRDPTCCIQCQSQYAERQPL